MVPPQNTGSAVRCRRITTGLSLLVAIVTISGVLLYRHRHGEIRFADELQAARDRRNAAFREVRLRGEPAWYSDLRSTDDTVFEMGDRAREILAQMSVRNGEFNKAMREWPEITSQQYAILNEVLSTKATVLEKLAAIEPVEDCRFWYDFETPCPAAT
ncbi:MAG: hypothetical protein R3C20_18405 [Planctomycetaceae bacterium]